MEHVRRKTLPKWSTQVRVSTVQDVSPLDDGLSWRKYGQKDILGAKYPRSARRRRTILFQPSMRGAHAHERC
jgi:hypothetical protein